MRQWKLTPEEEAEVLKRYDQSTPEIKRGIALEFAKRAIEGAVLVRKFQAALDAERAKVAGLVALLGECAAFIGEIDHDVLAELIDGRDGLPDRIEAAIRAAKEGTVPVQPATATESALRNALANMYEMVLAGDYSPDATGKLMERVCALLQHTRPHRSGEGTVPT